MYHLKQTTAGGAGTNATTKHPDLLKARDWHRAHVRRQRSNTSTPPQNSTGGGEIGTIGERKKGQSASLQTVRHYHLWRARDPGVLRSSTSNLRRPVQQWRIARQIWAKPSVQAVLQSVAGVFWLEGYPSMASRGKERRIQAPHQKSVVKTCFFKSSEWKAHPLTPTDLERDAALGDRKRDAPRALHDLSGGAEKHFTARILSSALMHRSHSGTNSFFSSAHFHFRF